MLEIDPVIVIMSSILTVAFCLPFAYQMRKNKNKEVLLKAEITSLAESSGAKPEITEFWRQRYAIGLDSSLGVLLYLQQEPKHLVQTLDLKNFKKVNITKIFEETSDKTHVHKLPEYISLDFIPKSPEDKNVVLEIYDGEEFSDLQGETVLAEKWAALLNILIR
ncbi:hypothetical protein ACPUEN_02710 [Algoriphagus yeomjeoni]|uniref:hypothetical protein n=1 Tax=Algoriphagus yeomjeoni TaxID=291403 RepID=UPI003CE5617E